ncbi:MAG: xanthine dehydrogenase [Nitrospiraceae bacterium]|nr:MAG: xanthine dehydrogenase [Nitrospiraceae bacterium]
MEIYEEIIRLKNEGRQCALATIVQCFGSSPQREGAKMLVRDDGTTLGTLGGGCIEAEVKQASMMAIKSGTPQTFPFQLNEKHGGLVCGGKILVYIEPVVPEPCLVILGAGHVGKALSTVARFSGFHVTVTDDREEYANRKNIPHAHDVIAEEFGTVFERLSVGRNTYIVIATRGHNHDLEALKAALGTEACYIGLLGSRRKKALLFRTLRDNGFAEEAVNRVITPVGLSIGSVTPEEIAISITAQIIQQRRMNAAPGLSRSSCSRLVKEDGTSEAAPPPER